MLIDMHSHIWDINNAPKVLTDNIRARIGDDRKAAELLSGEGLIRHLEEAGFDKAMVLALADRDMSTEQADAHNTNEELKKKQEEMGLETESLKGKV